MGKIKKFLCMLLVCTMVIAPCSLIANVFAQTEVSEPLTIDVSTDKSSYGTCGVAEITVKVTNTSNETVNNISAEAIFEQLAPVGKSNETFKEVDSLQPGESFSFSYKATLNADKVNLNFLEKIILWLVRLFKGGYKATNHNIELVTEKATVIKFGDYSAQNIVRVAYEKGSDSVVSRGEWIIKLTNALNCTEQIYSTNNDNDTFIDIIGVDCENAVRYASLMNVFDETTGYFYPDQPATREFVAVTAVRAMMFLNTQFIECADKNAIEHPQEVYTAVSAELFKLESNYFYPSREVTENECKRVLAKIIEIEATTNNTDNHSEIVYTDNFAEFQDNVGFTKNKNLLSIEITDETKELQTGNIIYLSGEYLKITDIKEQDGKYAVVTEEPSMQEVFQSINVHKSQDLTVGEFIPADGVSIVNQNQRTRSTINLDTISLELNKEIQENVNIYGEIAIKNPKLNYAIDIYWANFIPQFRDVHLILTFDTEFKAGISDTRKDKKPLKDGFLTLGSFPVIGIAGIGAYIEVAVGYTIEGKAEIIFTSKCETGYQIYNNLPKKIHSSLPNYDVTSIEASAKVGPKISGLLELTKKWKLIDFSLFSGVAIKGSLKIRDTGLICLNASTYVFAELEAMQESIISNWLDVKFSYEIWNEENSCLKKAFHFENLKFVPKCTYDIEYTVSGTVKDKSTNKAISNVTVSAIIPNSGSTTPVAQTKTDNNGNFSINLLKGNNALIFTHSNYANYAWQVTVDNSDITITEPIFLTQKSIPTDAIEFNGHYYQIYDEGMTWYEAKEYCENIGGHLVTITSQEEQAFVETLLVSAERNSYWLGAERINNAWTWVTFEKWEYANWAYNQPDNNDISPYESSLMMYNRENPRISCSKGEWNDLYYMGTCGNESFFGTNNFGFICEWEGTSEI